MLCFICNKDVDRVAFHLYKVHNYGNSLEVIPKPIVKKITNKKLKIEKISTSKLECKHLDSKVYDSRQRNDSIIWRRRECIKCSYRWTTLEIPVGNKINLIRKLVNVIETN